MAELPLTAVGKPHKVPLRLDAAARELAPRLHALGVHLPPDGAWCQDVAERLTVTLTLADDAVRHTVADLLDRYPLDHQLNIASAPPVTSTLDAPMPTNP